MIEFQNGKNILRKNFRMRIDTFIPYAKRHSKRVSWQTTASIKSNKDKKELKNILLKTFENDTKGLKLTKPIDNTGFDFCFVDFNTVQQKTLEESWSELIQNGWLVVKNTEANFEMVKKFRRDNKLTSILMTDDNLLYFQKENYSDRNIKEPALEVQMFKEQVSIPESVPVPDWQSSHLTEEYILKYGTGEIFIETGTYLGQTVEMVRRSSKDWSKIYSIELNYELAANAKRYFDFDPRIEIKFGDSVDKVSEICDNLRTFEKTATFWLDAHASGPLPGGRTGPNPLIEELEAIRKTGNKNHTIFIDDRRLFGSPEWGGLTEKEIEEALFNINPEYQIIYLDGEIPKDIICATTTVNEVDFTLSNKPVSFLGSEIPSNISQEFVLDDLG